jgi:endonuclease I
MNAVAANYWETTEKHASATANSSNAAYSSQNYKKIVKTDAEPSECAVSGFVAKKNSGWSISDEASLGRRSMKNPRKYHRIEDFSHSIHLFTDCAV